MMAQLAPLRPVVWLLLLVLPALGGCSSDAPVQTQDSGPLRELAQAYVEATHALQRAPSSADELKPYLAAGKNVEELLTSPTDGKPYVVVWGADPRTGMDLKPLVIGYEQQGANGSRFVFTAMGVMLMTNEDFKEAKFPAGHSPPP